MSNMWDTLLSYGEETNGPDRDWALSGAESTWIDVWLFGIVVDDDKHVSLGSYWNPNGDLAVKPSYYVPDDFDTNVPLVSVDTPPMVDVAWDSKGVAA